MDDPAVTSVPQNSDSGTRSDSVIRQFVEHWGMMARAWGINPTMGELFALMYITGTDWTAEELRSWLHVSRGNVSMNLRELLAWGVVRKLHRPGERRTLPCGNGSLDAVSENLERTKAARARPHADRPRPDLPTLGKRAGVARSEVTRRAPSPVLRADRCDGDPAALSRSARDGRSRRVSL